jgi:two-component system LytT family response regulator
MSADLLHALVVGKAPVRQIIMAHLAAHPDIRVVGECHTVTSGKAAVRELHPELLLLDLQLSGADALASADGIGARALPVIITTSYPMAALRGYDVGRVSYRIRPLNVEGLRALLGDARALIRGRLSTPYASRLTVRVSDGTMVVNAADIDWIEGDDGQVRLHANGGPQPVHETLGDLEHLLDPRRFVRVHRSAIVNMDRVWSVQPHRKGRCVLVLDSGARIITSVARSSIAQALRRAF